jgi:two-component system, NtrC family, response regulator GlrR
MSDDGTDRPVDVEPEAQLPPDGTRSLDDAALDARATVQRFWLVVTAGPDAGASFTSGKERAIVGTHSSSDFVLKDDTISRFHCEIDPSGKRPLIRDLGSRNGTQVNGVSVVGAHLRDGSLIRLGRTELRFELRSDPVTLPLHEGERFGAMVGRSVVMRHAFALLERAAASDSAVLLEGETGTGKEIAAESIHTLGARRDGPFVVVDCSAIPADLLESELFGHERGAFTGAVQSREGAFEAAVGGTIFLDEIGELPLDLQPKLLRALERKQVKRVGGNTYASVDVRVVAATNRSLRREVNERRFRSDLYYRLAVVEVRLPPLRERPEDLRLLVDHLLGSLQATDHPDASGLTTPAFIEELARHGWGGNVRELRNYLERCLVLRAKAPLDGEPAEPRLPELDQPLKVARERWNRVLERRYVDELLRRADGNVTAAARAAGVDRMYFYRLLWRYGLR